MSKANIVALAASKYHQRETYEEHKRGNKYVSYGVDNLFPQYLISLLNSSAVHSALTTSIAAMIYGRGATYTDERGKAIDIDDQLRKTCLDLKIQGGFVWEVYWSPEGNRIVQIKHSPFEQWRSAPMDEEGNVHSYFHCIDWAKETEFEVTEWDAYNPITASGDAVQIIYCKPFAVGSMYYPKPDYIGAVNWIEVDKQVSIFHNNNIQNGLHPGFSVHFKSGVPPKEERNEIRREIEQQLGGAENSGRFWMTFSDSPEQTPEIKPFEVSNLSDQFQFISQESTDKIMIGHRVTTPSLFGVKTAGQLSAASELEEAKRIFNKDVIEPFQRIVNEWLKEVEEFLGYSVQIENAMAEETPDVKESFTGIQISSAMDILTRVKLGELTIEQGRSLLSNMLNFSDEAVNDTLPLPIQMSAQTPDLDEDTGKKWLDYLNDKGEVMSEEWELLHESEVKDSVGEYKLHLSEARRVELFKRFANPEERSQVDAGLYKIRYRYSQQLKDNSRVFCRNMVENSKGGVSYRFEDIESMEGQVNTEFSPRGESSYSIWLWKGGCFCHHYWVRQVWFRKRDKGRFLPNEGLENDKRVSVADALADGFDMRDENLDYNQAGTRPIDTPNRGKLN